MPNPLSVLRDLIDAHPSVFVAVGSTIIVGCCALVAIFFVLDMEPRR